MTTNRDNTGTLARNDRKTEDRHPDIRGQCTIEGRAYWIAGWKRQSERGTYYSLAFTPKDEQPPQAAQAKPAPTTKSALDDEIPF